jgi:hypothetical protein
MIDKNHTLPITRQAKLVAMSGETVYSCPKEVNERDLEGIWAVRRYTGSPKPAVGTLENLSLAAERQGG